MEHFTDLNWNVRLYCLCLIIPLLLLCLVKNFRVLAPVSIIANIVTILGLGFIFRFILQDLPAFTDRPMYRDISRFPMFLGIVLFGLCTIGLVSIRYRKGDTRGAGA